jgi:hypothetical protein
MFELFGDEDNNDNEHTDNKKIKTYSFELFV